MARLVLAALFTLITLAAPAQAQRVALLIANANYGGELPKLANPVQDAQGIAKLLGPNGLKFDSVTLIKDASGPQMKQALASFAQQARTADMALVYVAGFSNGSINIPLGPGGLDTAVLGVEGKSPADYDDAVKVGRQSLSEREIMTALQAAGTRGALLLFDVDRSAGRTASTRSLSIGREQPGAELPAFPIIYATEPGGRASDGAPGKGGPFANAFVRHAAVPNRPLWEIYALVKTEVEEQGTGSQRPSRNRGGDWFTTLTSVAR